MWYGWTKREKEKRSKRDVEAAVPRVALELRVVLGGVVKEDDQIVGDGPESLVPRLPHRRRQLVSKAPTQPTHAN